MRTLVMKFGGAAVATPNHFSHIADIIIAKLNEFPRLVIVVSAMGRTTDQLIELAEAVHPHPPQREYDMLISVGERISMSLLAMALLKRNCEAVSFTGSQSGIITCDKHSNATILDVKPYRLADALLKEKIVIVGGFQGVSRRGEITTLGRGGSDTSAVALGVSLKFLNFDISAVEYYKDVLGFYDSDPKLNENAQFYSRLTYDEALTIIGKGGRILHDRAVKLARENSFPLHVRSFLPTNLLTNGTLIQDSSLTNVKYPKYEES